MRTYKIHLIRHGLTDGNLKGLYIGETNLPLCDEGAAELLLMTQEYFYPQVEAVYSSPKKRCLQTAEIIYPAYTPIAVESLREVNFGVFEGKSAQDLKDTPEFIEWVTGGYMGTPPEGEDAMTFYNRCKDGFSQVFSHMMKEGIFSAAIITHGAVIMNIMAAFSAVKKESFLDWRVDSGAGYTVSVTPQLWMMGQIFEEKCLIPDGMYESTEEEQYRFIEIEEDGEQGE